MPAGMGREDTRIPLGLGAARAPGVSMPVQGDGAWCLTGAQAVLAAAEGSGRRRPMV